MVDTFLAVLRKDLDAVLAGLESIGLLVEVADMRPVRRVISFLLERFTERPVDLQEFELIRAEVGAMYSQQPFRLPPEMTAILKALSTLDGIARTLDPAYNLLQSAQPFVRRVAIAERGTIMRRAGQQLVQLVRGSFGRQNNQPTSSQIGIVEYSEPSVSLPDPYSAYLKRRKRQITAAKSLGSALLGAALIMSGVVFWPVIAVGWSYLFFASGALGGVVSLGYLIKFLILRKLDKLLP
jgi:predicted unusual protein kinase regulating ubiquinone biosynthesis (AarF/ABC1/UbiB family)